MHNCNDLPSADSGCPIRPKPRGLDRGAGPRPGALEGVIESVYRPDLHREIAAELAIPAPTIDWKIEGAHETSWVLEDATAPIPMAPDRFLDGAPFDPRDLPRHLEGLGISSLRIRPDELPACLGASC